MYDYNLQMPIDICVNTYYQEQKCVYLSHLKFIKQNDYVLFDRNYFSYKLYNEIIKRKAFGIFRLKKQINVVKEFVKSNSFDNIVKLKDGNKIRLIKYYVKTVKSNSTAEPTIITKYPTKEPSCLAVNTFSLP